MITGESLFKYNRFITDLEQSFKEGPSYALLTDLLCHMHNYLLCAADVDNLEDIQDSEEWKEVCSVWGRVSNVANKAPWYYDDFTMFKELIYQPAFSEVVTKYFDESLYLTLVTYEDFLWCRDNSTPVKDQLLTFLIDNPDIVSVGKCLNDFDISNKRDSIYVTVEKETTTEYRDVIRAELEKMYNTDPRVRGNIEYTHVFVSDIPERVCQCLFKINSSKAL